MEYEVSPGIRAVAKTVGGIFTVTQTIFLGLALLTGGGLGLITYRATSSIPLTILVFILGASPFLPFALIKIEKLGDMELFPYLMLRLRYHYSKKVYININDNKRQALLSKK